MDYLEKAKAALDLIRRGREALSGVTSAVKDGSAALSATQQAELDAMLAKEEAETAASIAEGRDAIAEFRRNQG